MIRLSFFAVSLTLSLGKSNFRNTRFMVSAAGAIYTIEKNGTLYRVEPWPASLSSP